MAAADWQRFHAGYACDAPLCKEMFLDSMGFQPHKESIVLAATAEQAGWTRWERIGEDRIYTYCPAHAGRYPRLAHHRGFVPTWTTTWRRRYDDREQGD